MRHCRNIVLALVIATISSGAFACSCVKWDPSYLVAEYAEIFVGEVTASDPANPEVVNYDAKPMRAVPITVAVFEQLKGGSAGSRRLLQVGQPSSCAISLAVGERRVFLIWKPGQTLVGYCHVLPANEVILGELRLAAKGSQ
jgi:hypothetical protein